jgi:hypothetical protein
MSRFTLVNYVQKRPTNVFRFHYANEEGQARSISCPVGWGRFNRGTEDAAYELAERRLGEQFGDECLAKEDRIREQRGNYQDPGAQLLRDRPEIHQDNYTLVKVERL